MSQLQEAEVKEVPDKQYLMEFIKSITHDANYHGERDMKDMLRLVRNFYYHPLMGGSNSLKFVLPAILNSSNYIQAKYSKPIYGKNLEIRSLNFEDGWIWIKEDDKGNLINPYNLLPPEGIDDQQIEQFLMRTNIQEGGATMTAYAKMQFTKISDTERNRIINGLLKYCELDILAMIMVWEYWNNLIDN